MLISGAMLTVVKTVTVCDWLSMV